MSYCLKQSSKKNIDKSNKSKNSFRELELLESKSSLLIKAYMGMEYECPLGHRFICSGPDRLVKVSNNGVVKV